MTGFRADEFLVGIVAAAAVAWIFWTLRRGLRDGILPIRKGRVVRAERSGAFNVLFVLYVVAALLMAFIALDLLFGLDLRSRL